MLKNHYIGLNKSNFELKNKIDNRRTPSFWIKIETKNKIDYHEFLKLKSGFEHKNLQ